MNLTLWVWGRWGIAVAASILLGFPAVAAPIKISQAGSQQQGNPAAVEAQRAYDRAEQLSKQGTVESKRQAIATWEEALKLYRATGDRSGEAVTLNNIGSVYSELGEKQKALEYYSQSLPLFRATGDRSGEATILNNIGSVYSDLGEKQKALEYYSQSLPLRRAVGNRRGEAVTLTNIGGVYSDLGEKQKALEYYSQSLPLFRAVGDRSGEAVTLYNMAYAKRALGNLTEALTDIEASIKIIENLRTKIASPELRTSYFATVQNYNKFYIDLLMQLHKQQPKAGYDTKALEASERLKAQPR